MKAIWNDVIIAESQDTIVVEGNHYFPPDSVKKQYLRDSNTTSECYWKGAASYYSVEVKGETNHDASWYYPKPFQKARNIKNHVAFWKGITISK